MVSKRLSLIAISLALLSAGALHAAGPELPARDLRLEIRQVDEQGPSYTAGKRRGAPLLPPRMVEVRNGEEARISYSQSVPLQWTQSAQAAGPMTGAAVQQGLIWLDAGHSLVLRPRWSGGQQPATVEVKMELASIDTNNSNPLPTQTREATATTVRAPLGEWVTLARNGEAPPQGTYRSEVSSQRPRLLQLRVTTP
jgi:Bacterial type II and III secretion system protein